MAVPLSIAAHVFALLSALSRPRAPRRRRPTPRPRIGADVDKAVHYLPERERRAAAELLVAIAWHESKLRRDVDLGPCAPSRVAHGWCDGGRAVGLWQLHGIDWDTPRAEQARLSVRRAYGSMRSCRHRLPEERLALYASGASCDDARGLKASREIWRDLQLVRGLRVSR